MARITNEEIKVQGDDGYVFRERFVYFKHGSPTDILGWDLWLRGYFNEWDDTDNESCPDWMIGLVDAVASC